MAIHIFFNYIEDVKLNISLRMREFEEKEQSLKKSHPFYIYII